MPIHASDDTFSLVHSLGYGLESKIVRFVCHPISIELRCVIDELANDVNSGISGRCGIVVRLVDKVSV